jgi:Tol biopolymer transport system component
LHSVQAHGRNARILTDALDLEGDPAWSPDGHEVVLERLEERSDVVLLDVPRS